MLLNGAYLVEARPASGGCASSSSELERAPPRRSAPGSSSTGPWPPYNFVPDARLSAPRERHDRASATSRWSTSSTACSAAAS